MLIREAKIQDADELARLISTSYLTVAQKLDLTPENTPKHPSNCRPDWVTADMERGVTYWIVEENGANVGCVALERAKPEVFYMERLAVLPEYRRQGLGTLLVKYVLDQARADGASRVEIGIIAAQTDLRYWYENLGFILTGTKTFPHLPFEVAFLFRDI